MPRKVCKKSSSRAEKYLQSFLYSLFAVSIWSLVHVVHIKIGQGAVESKSWADDITCEATEDDKLFNFLYDSAGISWQDVW